MKGDALRRGPKEVQLGGLGREKVGGLKRQKTGREGGGKSATKKGKFEFTVVYYAETGEGGEKRTNDVTHLNPKIEDPGRTPKSPQEEKWLATA